MPIIRLTEPQLEFVKAEDQFPCVVAGFGCVHPDTRIWTEFGLMRIADVDRPMRVLSWDETGQKFQLSLSTASFPKGRGTLHRVSTQSGEWTSSGHHRIFSSDHTYRPVEGLLAGARVLSASLDLQRTSQELARQSSLADDPRYSRTTVDYLDRYGAEARLYGQRFLLEAGSGLGGAQAQGGALGSGQCSDWLVGEHTDDRPVHWLERSHPDQFAVQTCKSHSVLRTPIHGRDGEGQTSALPLERTYDSRPASSQSGETCGHHHTTQQHEPGALASSDSMVSEAEVLQVTALDGGVYYDMQVLDTNNYVDEFGHIHHNSGKTQAAVVRAIVKKLQYPKQDVGYYLPTYDLVRRIGFPRFSELLETMGVPNTINKADAVIDIHNAGSIIFRTMDNPERIVGYEVADSLVDELDTLPVDKARDVWNKIISRNRQKKPDGSVNSVAVATTPEGYRFVYERWHKNPAAGYRMIKATTYSNARNLPDGYIDSLKASYPSNLLAAYLDGEFVNLTSGSVYPEFDRVKNASTETIQPDDTLHVGMDFNVGKMAAVVCVLRGDDPHAVREHTGMLDTPSTIALLKVKYPNHKILVYPDASGNARKSNNASESDLVLLKAAGFRVMVNSKNPAVKDRVLSANHMILAEGKRRLRVNPEGCPELCEALEKQAYDKHGEPDKSAGLDHIVDACTYLLVYRYPIKGKYSLSNVA
jgi:hypothetical protein